MKIVVYGNDKRVGAIRGNSIVDLSRAYAKYLREKKGEGQAELLAGAHVPPNLRLFIEGGPRVLESAAIALDHLGRNTDNEKDADGNAVVHPASAVRLHAPHPEGARIACAGGNFADHIMGMAANLPQKIPGMPPLTKETAVAEIRALGTWGFWKVGREIAGPDDDVIYPTSRCDRLDYEGEVAIILGRKGKNIPRAEARSYIWGVTLLGDWSVRTPREPKTPRNFGLGKNFDTSCSLGPCIAVGEVDATEVQVEVLVNGERRQYFNNGDMVVSYDEYIEYLSRDFTLYPGDMISGGTAAGTAADASPILPDGEQDRKLFLKPGDIVDIRSPSIGNLRSRIV